MSISYIEDNAEMDSVNATNAETDSVNAKTAGISDFVFMMFSSKKRRSRNGAACRFGKAVVIPYPAPWRVKTG
jgi:hypothetical protein